MGYFGDFINEWLGDVEGESGVFFYDILYEFMYEGEGSFVGFFSLINMLLSGGSQDYEYFQEWGLKFVKFVDMYNIYEDFD